MNCKNGMVSVITPVYNREKYIEECINSVREQSYQNFEIVLVDDGSTDNTLDICKNLAKKDSRIKIFVGEHKGVSFARNIALDKAEGEYLFFLDSDDVIHPLLFEALVEGMQKENVSISGTGCITINQKNWHRLEEFKEKFPAPAKLEVLDNTSAVKGMFSGGTPLNLIGGCMMRRDYVGSTRFNTKIFIGEDYLFIYENLIKGTSAAFLEQKWYYVRNHDSNTSWNWGFEGFLTRFNRRLIVAESEEKLGRTEFSNIQKRDAFFVFASCQGKNKLSSPDAKKMRKQVKQYKKLLFPAFSFRDKILYVLAVYFPSLYYAALKRHKKRRLKNRAK